MEIPVQDIVGMQRDISDLQDDMEVAGTTVGKVAFWTGVAVGLGIIAVYSVYQISQRIKVLESQKQQ